MLTLASSALEFHTRATHAIVSSVHVRASFARSFKSVFMTILDNFEDLSNGSPRLGFWISFFDSEARSLIRTLVLNIRILVVLDTNCFPDWIQERSSGLYDLVYHLACNRISVHGFEINGFAGSFDLLIPYHDWRGCFEVHRFLVGLLVSLLRPCSSLAIYQFV